MKFVERPDREVEFGGLGETAAMTIKADARAFRNLVDSIYAEKEKTVVRELMANALDANAMAGRPDAKINVHLPTTFEPVFKVRDYGVGMSHDFIMNHYSNLFESTKQGDNTQTGMFGVGSKSPLAISDTFTILCFDPPGGDETNGRYPAQCRRYMVTVPAEGVPQISRTDDPVLEDPWDENHCGVEISVPINRDNRAKLLEGLADQQFFWFDKPVDFSGAFDEVKDKLHSSISKLTEGLYIVGARDETHSYRSYNNREWNVYARQGAAVYPVKQDQVTPHIPVHLTETIKKLCGKGRKLFFDFPIGTAEVTLARESIQYGPITCAKIADIVTTTFQGFSDMLSSVVGDSHTFPEALRALVLHTSGKEYDVATWSERRSAASLLALVKDHVVNNHIALFEDTKPLPQLHTDVELSDFPDGKVLLHDAKLWYQNGVSLHIEGVSTRLRFKHPNVVYIIPSHLQKWQDRLKQHANSHWNADHFGGVNGHSNDGVSVRVIRCAKRNIDEIVEMLKAKDIYYIHYGFDDLPGVVAADAKVRNYSKTSVYPFTGSTFSENKTEPDYTEPAYYIARVGISSEVTFHDPRTSLVNGADVQRRSRVSNGEFSRIVTNARKAGLIDDAIPIYRVTDNQAERLITSKKIPWVHFPNHLYETLPPRLKNTNGALEMQASDLTSAEFGLKFLCERGLVSHTPGENDPIKRECLKVLRKLCDADRVFKYRLAVHVARDRGNTLIETDKTLHDLAGDLRLKDESIDHDRVQGYNRLDAEYNTRFSFVEGLIERGLRYAYEDEVKLEALTHLNLYITGLVDFLPTKAHTVTELTFTHLDGLLQGLEDAFFQAENEIPEQPETDNAEAA